MTNDSSLYLPDTSLFIHYGRQSLLAQQIENTYGLNSGDKNPLVSVVTIGELRAFAQLRQWGKVRLRQAEELLGKCEVISIEDEKILDAYADLNTYSIRAGRPLGDNDLWIAATALVTGATLLTTDKDFDHLHPNFIQRVWIDPATR